MKPKMSAAPPSASQSEALHNQSDTCVQRCPKRYQTDCEEKRDPDERQRSLTIKENELDPNAQLEKRTFVDWSVKLLRRGPSEPTFAAVPKSWPTGTHTSRTKLLFLCSGGANYISVC